MAKRVGRLGVVLLVAIGGCVSLGDDALPQVASNPFSPNPQPITETSLAAQEPASDAVSKRVAVVGQKIVALNPDIGMRPHFLTIGSPTLDVTHVGTTDLYVTEGLANRCTTEGQLAAVLAQGLGKMVTEREILTGAATRSIHREPPPEMPVGRDSGGVWGSPDGVRMAELAKYEKERPRNDPPPAPPDPQILARGILERAGYQRTDLDDVAPLLREADAHAGFKRQLLPSQTSLPAAK